MIVICDRCKAEGECEFLLPPLGWLAIYDSGGFSKLYCEGHEFVEESIKDK